jgi:hypothetical protein
MDVRIVVICISDSSFSFQDKGNLRNFVKIVIRIIVKLYQILRIFCVSSFAVCTSCLVNEDRIFFVVGY